MAVQAKVAKQGLEQLEEKFLRLLETDRKSKEFEALFREVDVELGRAVAQKSRRTARP